MMDLLFFSFSCNGRFFFFFCRSLIEVNSLGEVQRIFDSSRLKILNVLASPFSARMGTGPGLPFSCFALERIFSYHFFFERIGSFPWTGQELSFFPLSLEPQVSSTGKIVTSRTVLLMGRRTMFFSLLRWGLCCAPFPPRKDKDLPPPYMRGKFSLPRHLRLSGRGGKPFPLSFFFFPPPANDVPPLRQQRRRSCCMRTVNCSHRH